MTSCDEQCVNSLRDQVFLQSLLHSSEDYLQVDSLKGQLNVYKPVLLALTTALVCIG